MKTFSLRYFLRSAKRLQNDTHKLFARVTVKGKRTDFSLNRRVRWCEWDKAGGCPEGCSPRVKELERFMLTIEEKSYAIERELFESGITVMGELSHPQQKLPELIIPAVFALNHNRNYQIFIIKSFLILF
jgi:hypothetical protein